MVGALWNARCWRGRSCWMCACSAQCMRRGRPRWPMRWRTRRRRRDGERHELAGVGRRLMPHVGRVWIGSRSAGQAARERTWLVRLEPPAQGSLYQVWRGTTQKGAGGRWGFRPRAGAGSTANQPQIAPNSSRNRPGADSGSSVPTDLRSELDRAQTDPDRLESGPESTTNCAHRYCAPFMGPADPTGTGDMCHSDPMGGGGSWVAATPWVAAIENPWAAAALWVAAATPGAAAITWEAAIP